MGLFEVLASLQVFLGLRYKGIPGWSFGLQFLADHVGQGLLTSAELDHDGLDRHGPVALAVWSWSGAKPIRLPIGVSRHSGRALIAGARGQQADE
jgi:hypothetical protein